MRTLKLTLAYDGSDYVGWQRQAEGVSIQGLIEDALQPIEGAHVTVHGAGRTDAGVHALAQVATFRLSATLDSTTLARALNAVLPPDVRVVDAEEVPTDFHARFSAKGKVYEYRIINGPVASPFVRRYAWHLIPPLDLSAMDAASEILLGTHDFSSFRAAGTLVASAERTIHRLTLTGGCAPEVPIVFEIEGDGFLRHMVRNIVGTLVDVGLGRLPAAEMERILRSRDRSHAGVTAPPLGLFLKRVLY